jgi:peptidoglycan/LPS O-acetylase OafA/YrhL
MTGPRAPCPPKLECYDSLRGLAALGVVCAHLIIAFWPGVYFRSGPAWERAPTWLRLLYSFHGKYLVNGCLIVPAFYVLSGFVLSLPYFRGGGATTLGSAATRRYLRLMLPVAFSIFVAYGLMTCGAMRNQDAVRRLHETYGIAENAPPPARPGAANHWLASHYNFAPSFPSALRDATYGAFTGMSLYNQVLYTMPDELVGSYLVFAFLALFGNVRNRGLLYAVAGGLCLVGNRWNLLDFVFGLALCDLWWQNQQRLRWDLPLRWALLLFALGVFVIPGATRCQPYVVIGAVVASSRLQMLLAAPWLTFLGRVSFGLFTLHMPILCSLGCGVYLMLSRGWGWSHAAATVTAAGVSLATALVAGWVFYLVVDRPTLGLTRWLDRRLFRPPPAAESTRPLAKAA